MKNNFRHSFLFCLPAFILSVLTISLAAVEKTSYTNKEMDLKINLRRICADSLTWQRVYFVEAVASGMESDKALGRFSKCEADLAAIFKPFLGDTTSTQLNDLLNQYTQMMTDYINAAKSGGDKSYITGKIHDNADSIADILSKSNMSWIRNDLTIMLRRYYDMIDSEIDTQVNKLGSLDTTVIDASMDEAMTIADYYSSGLMQQYPGNFW